MNEVTKFENLVPTYERPLSSLEVRAQVQLIQEVLRDTMIAGVHYGYPPGTEPKNDEEKKTKKPGLLKPGAELLCVVFRFDPQYSIERTRLPDHHLEVVSTCTLHYIPNGRRVGSGMGSATTEESKHAYRWSGRTCPACGADAITRSRFAEEWFCFERKGGCKAKFSLHDPEITEQEVGRIANPDLPDQYNTVLKMANKRAIVGAILTATAASDMFDQDVEELNPEADYEEGDPRRKADPKVEQHRKRDSEPAGASGTTQRQGSPSAGAGAASGPFKPMLPQMKTMIEAKLKNAGLTLIDLEAHFQKKLAATDDNGFGFGDFATIEQWISQNRKS